MEEAKHDCQFPLDWGSMQDVTSWGPNVGMKSNLTNLLFICNIVEFIINDLSVHFIIFLIHVPL